MFSGKPIVSLPPKNVVLTFRGLQDKIVESWQQEGISPSGNLSDVTIATELPSTPTQIQLKLSFP